MPWTNERGTTLEYPFALAAKAARSGNEDAIAVIEATRRIFDEAMRLDALVRELKAENQRLRHENEFMLRLLADRDE